MQIILEHNTTHFKFYYEVDKLVKQTPIYKIIDLKLNELEDGEYTLTLYNNSNAVLCKELIKIGDNKCKNYKQARKYTQYARR